MKVEIFLCVLTLNLFSLVKTTEVSSKLDFGNVAKARSDPGPPIYRHAPRSGDGFISQRRRNTVEHPKPTPSSTIEIVNKISIKDSNGQSRTLKCDSCENTASQVVITGKTDDKVLTDIKISLESASQKTTTEKTTEVTAEKTPDDEADVPVFIGFKGTPPTPAFIPKIPPINRGFVPQPNFKPLHHYEPKTDTNINPGSFEPDRNTQYFEYRLGDWVPCTCGRQQASWNGEETPKLPAGEGPHLGPPRYNPSFAPSSTNFQSNTHSFVNQRRPSVSSFSGRDGWNRRHDWRPTERMIIDDKLQPPFSNTYKDFY